MLPSPSGFSPKFTMNCQYQKILPLILTHHHSHFLAATFNLKHNDFLGGLHFVFSFNVLDNISLFSVIACYKATLLVSHPHLHYHFISVYNFIKGFWPFFLRIFAVLVTGWISIFFLFVSTGMMASAR